MAHTGNLLIHLVALCVVFWTVESDHAPAQAAGQAAKPFLVRTIRQVEAPNFRPVLFGQKKSDVPQTFTTYPAGTFLQLGGPRDGTCGESKLPPPDQYCVNGKATDHGEFDDQFLVDKAAVEPVDVVFYTPARHFRANREAVLYDIPWGHGPILPSDIREETTKLTKGADVGVSVVKGPYYQIDFRIEPNKFSAWAEGSGFDKAEGAPPIESDVGARADANSEDPETPEDLVSWMIRWAVISTVALVFCGWFFYGARGGGGRWPSR